jgi:hypothetical protein
MFSSKSNASALHMYMSSFYLSIFIIYTFHRLDQEHCDVATCFALVFFFKINKYNCNFLKQGNHGLKNKKKKTMLCYALPPANPIFKTTLCFFLY